ncbi:MAG: hypothetical protein V1775_19450 [Bacteroidota bacterium]
MEPKNNADSDMAGKYSQYNELTNCLPQFASFFMKSATDYTDDEIYGEPAESIKINFG